MEGVELRELNTLGSPLQSDHPPLRHGGSRAEGRVCGARASPHRPEAGRAQGLPCAGCSVRGAGALPGLSTCSSCSRRCPFPGRPGAGHPAPEKETPAVVCSRTLIFLVEEPEEGPVRAWTCFPSGGQPGCGTGRQRGAPARPGPAGRAAHIRAGRKAAGKGTRLPPAPARLGRRKRAAEGRRVSPKPLFTEGRAEQAP